MKKSELRHIIKKIIQEQTDVATVDKGTDPGPEDQTGWGWGGSGFDTMYELDALQFQIAEQFANDQLMYALFGNTNTGAISDAYASDLENATQDGYELQLPDTLDPDEGYIDTNSIIGMALEGENYLPQIVNALVDYANNLDTTPSTNQPTFGQGQFNYSGNDPSTYNYFFQHYQASTGNEVAESFENYLLSLCQASPLMLTTISQQNTAAGEMIRNHMAALSTKPGVMNAFANDPLNVPFPWCPTMFHGCFPNCLETPWVQYGMNSEEYCKERWPDPEMPETQCTNYLYYSCMNINFLPVEVTAKSDHGCQDPAATNYKEDAALPCACDTAGINDNCPCDYTVAPDRGTKTEPDPEPMVDLEPIKKDIPVEPPRPTSTPISPKSKETSPKFPTMPKITPPTSINNITKTRLQELANIRKRK